MSKTTNLQLFKHDEPLETNENDFDIDEALNDNWDILDTFAGQVNTRLETLEDDLDEISTNLDTLETSIETIQSSVTSLQTDNETNKQDIQDLQSEQETQNTAIENNTQELELLKNNLPDPITTDQSEEITVQDAMNYYSELDVSGNRTQATRSGKNKLYLADVAEATNAHGITYSVKDGVITLNGTSIRVHYINFNSSKFDLPAGDYTMSGKELAGSCSGSSGKQLNNEDNSKNLFNGGTMTSTVSNTLENDETGVHLALYIGSTAVFNNYKFEVQLEEGTQATEIEKYGAMPSPDYPSKIKNCGDNVNFVGGALTVGYYGLSGQLTSDNLYRCFKANLKKGTYKYSYNADLYFVRQINLTTGTNLTINNNSFTLENDAEISLGFRRSDSYAWDLGETLEDLQFAIKEGTGEVRYSPYKCGSVDIKVENANKYVPFSAGVNIRGVTASFFSSGNIALNGTATASGGRDATKNVSTKNLLKAGQAYTMYVEVISGTGQTGHVYLNRVSDNSGLRFCQDGSVRNFTQNEDIEVYWGINVTQGNVYDNLILRFGLFEGTYTYEEIKKKFVVHEEKIITFPLKEGQRLHLGDYLSDNGIHHVRKTRRIYVDDFTYSVTEGGLLILSNRAGAIWDYTSIKGLCTHFKNAEDETITVNGAAANLEDGEFNFRAGTTKDRIYFKNSAFTTSTDWRNFFNENEVLLEYECTEYIEAYTEEQQAVYNQLQRLLLYKGYNYITCTDETKCKMQLTYRPDNTSKIKSLEERVAALENSEVTA